MVNAKNITLAALTTTVVVAVVGVEVYNSGTYKTQISFHGQDIKSAQVYAESVQACGDVSRQAKGDNMSACIESNKRTEAKLEMENGIVFAQINDDCSLFTRTATGLVHVGDASALEMKVVMGSEAEANMEKYGDYEVTKVNNTINMGPDMKLIIDEVSSNPKPLDFSEERAASSRSLLATRQNRNLWGRAKKIAKKVKKKTLCLGHIAMFIFNFFKCNGCIAATGATGGAALALLGFWCIVACIGMVTQALNAIYRCTGWLWSYYQRRKPPTPSTFPTTTGELNSLKSAAG
jgi:hypothetical protein